MTALPSLRTKLSVRSPIGVGRRCSARNRFAGAVKWPYLECTPLTLGLLDLLGVDERPSHTLDELISVVFVGEHFRWHMLGQEGFGVTSWNFCENLNSRHMWLRPYELARLVHDYFAAGDLRRIREDLLEVLLAHPVRCDAG